MFILSAQTTQDTVDTMKTTLPLLLLLTWPTSAHSRVSVTVVPNRSQFFEYEEFSVSCGPSEDWTVWRYTSKGMHLSQCGSGWGSLTSSSACDMKTVKVLSSGVYWCESKHGCSSNAVNITISNSPVILHSPVLPVVEGHDVPLRCETRPSSTSSAIYKDDDILIESTGHTTLRNFSKVNEGAYKCVITSDGARRESPTTWLLMSDDSDQASLTVSPDSSQLHEYEDLTLSCGADSGLRGWTVRRFTTTTGGGGGGGGRLSSCGDEWGAATWSGCVINTVKHPDSAVYWCESPSRQRSNSVNITVHGGPVILQSPVLPVMEGHDVTLSCQSKETPPSNPPAAFYKDGSLIRTEPTRHMTIHHVTKSDEGLYSCDITGHGGSPPSWLFVVDTRSSASEPVVTMVTVIRYIVVSCPYLVSTVLMVSKYRQQSAGNAPPVVSMAMLTPGEGDEGLDEEYDDVAADVTTEHQF